MHGYACFLLGAVFRNALSPSFCSYAHRGAKGYVVILQDWSGIEVKKCTQTQILHILVFQEDNAEGNPAEIQYFLFVTPPKDPTHDAPAVIACWTYLCNHELFKQLVTGKAVILFSDGGKHFKSRFNIPFLYFLDAKLRAQFQACLYAAVMFVTDHGSGPADRSAALASKKVEFEAVAYHSNLMDQGTMLNILKKLATHPVVLSVPSTESASKSGFPRSLFEPCAGITDAHVFVPAYGRKFVFYWMEWNSELGLDLDATAPTVRNPHEKFDMTHYDGQFMVNQQELDYLEKMWQEAVVRTDLSSNDFF